MSAGVELEYEYKCGFTKYYVRRSAQGEWSVVHSRKLLGLFKRPDEVFELKNFRAAVLRYWVDDGIEFRDVHLEPRSGKRVLVDPHTDADGHAWWAEMFAKAGLPVVEE